MVLAPVERNTSSVLKRVCRLYCSQSLAAQRQEGCGFETESGTFPCRVCVGFSPGAPTHTRLTVWLVVCLPVCVCVAPVMNCQRKKMLSLRSGFSVLLQVLRRSPSFMQSRVSSRRRQSFFFSVFLHPLWLKEGLTKSWRRGRCLAVSTRRLMDL